MNKIIAVIYISLLLITVDAVGQQKLSPVNLKCELLVNPIGVDVLYPGLSYQLTTDKNIKNVNQSAYQIIVSDSKDFKPGHYLWNSKKIVDDRMAYITYAGNAALKSGQKCWWKVRVWDQHGIVSGWSQPASWTMGILKRQDWKAGWISAAGAEKYAHEYKSSKTDFKLKRDLQEFRKYKPVLNEPNFSSMLVRKAFRVKPQLSRAVIHICGLGQYELTVNGKKIGDQILSPGWSDYRKTVLYDSYDITTQLKTGANAIGIILSNGMYNIAPDSVRYVKFLTSFGPLKVIAMLELEYADGSSEIVGTDHQWQVSPGPVTYSNLYGGEDYDARLEPAGWNTAIFKGEANWADAVDCPSPGGELKGLSCAAPPIKAIESLTPVNIVKIKPDLWVYDLGQNASVMPEITVKGTRGAIVRITPAELLKPDGTVDRRSVTQDGVRPAWWQYTLASGKSEKWFPKFFYQGGRYLQVELYPAQGETTLPVIETLKGIVVHSSSTPIGSFSCSNKLFNDIYKMVRWAQRSNMMSIMTDCPHREKQGWLEECHLNGPALRYNFDMAVLFRKVMNDMSDSQLQSGLVPNIAPEFFYASPDPNNPFRNSPEWGSSFIIIPWQQYLFSGDRSLMRNYFQKMKRYVSFLEASAKDGILYSGLGDWYDIGPKPAWGSQLTPESFTATAIYFYDNQIMSKMAALLDLKTDADAYAQKAVTIRKAFNSKFYNAAASSYATASNTTYAMPLYLNIADPLNRKALVNNLIADIRKQGNAFTSGEVGYRYLLGALAEADKSNVIYDMNNQSDKPGYGYELKMGATALTEKWDAGVGDFGSQNHFMSGEINEWLFDGLAGIRPEETGGGFRKFIIKPAFLRTLNWVKGSYSSISGEIKCDWKRTGKQLHVNITTPINTVATIFLPVVNTATIKQISNMYGVNYVGSENGSAKCIVNSGTYHFLVPE